jgi:hypothetical protein
LGRVRVGLEYNVEQLGCVHTRLLLPPVEAEMIPVFCRKWLDFRCYVLRPTDKHPNPGQINIAA